MRLAFLLLVFGGGIGVQAGETWHWHRDDSGLAIQGYDPVAYFRQNQATPGKAKITTSYQGLTYRFANKAHRAAFRESPDQYLPRYGGWCAFAAGVDPEKTGWGAVRFPADPKSFKIVDGELYLFAKVPNFDAKARWEAEGHPAMKQRADAFWANRERLAGQVGELPQGMNPRAPMETAQFKPFLGTWTNEVRYLIDPEKQTYGPPTKGTWTFDFGWDGFTIRDEYRVDGQAGSGGPAYRWFDPRTKQWVMTYLPVNQPSEQIWVMNGSFDTEGNLRAERDGVDFQGRPIKARIHFTQIKSDSFRWSTDWSYDEGKTWVENIMVATNRRIHGPQASK